MNLVTALSNNGFQYKNSYNNKKTSIEWQKIPLYTETKQSKINTVEALKLIRNGFCSEIKESVGNIIKNPIPAVVASGVTAGGMALLPLIGIPVAVGGAVLTVGIAGFSLVKTASNIQLAIENNKQLKSNEAKKYFSEIGKSSVGFAFSLPFIPKSIKSISEFAKYGKIALNTPLINDLQKTSGFINKFKVLKKVNNEFLRNYDYQRVAEQEIAKLDIPKVDKIKILDYVKQYNVPEEKIPETVLEILKKENGLEGIDISIVRKPMSARGSWNARNATINLKDRSVTDVPVTRNLYEIDTSVPKVLTPDGKNYVFELVDITGNRVKKIISKQVLDDYGALNTMYENTSRQGQTISTMTHEFEHFLQDVKMARAGELDKTLSEESRALFAEAVRRKGRITDKNILNPEYAEVQRYVNAVHTPKIDSLTYIQDAKELSSRMAQKRLFNTREFQVLDSVFKNLTPQRVATFFKELFTSITQLNLSFYNELE